MTYTINQKSVVIPDAEILHLESTLNITHLEAVELWLSDHDYIQNEEVEQLTRVAKKNKITGTIHAASGLKTAKNQRPRKENPLKKVIINIIYRALVRELDENDSVSVQNDEKYIDFVIEDRHFTLNLVEHRAK